MAFAVVVEVDNSGEAPDDARRRLHDQLAPSVRLLPGFQSLLFLTALERGLGYGVVVFDERSQAEGLAELLVPGSHPQEGVTLLRTEVLDVEVAVAG